uniref:Uncharacterized protein n=1 Tax=Arundo donax TaxID=35708 RepID=A0A0A9CAQ8_ARUDO
MASSTIRKDCSISIILSCLNNCQRSYPQPATATAVFRGSTASGCGGLLLVFTAQNRQPWVQVSPRSMIVAVSMPSPSPLAPSSPFQRSPMLGHWASTQTVLSLRSPSDSLSLGYLLYVAHLLAMVQRRWERHPLCRRRRFLLGSLDLPSIAASVTVAWGSSPQPEESERHFMVSDLEILQNQNLLVAVDQQLLLLLLARRNRWPGELHGPPSSPRTGGGLAEAAGGGAVARRGRGQLL